MRTTKNETIFQLFHWYISQDGQFWNHCGEQADFLASLGVTHAWLPPAYKSWRGIHEPGYAVYDHFDLGEFDQKGTVRTKYGTKKEYLRAIRRLQKAGIKVIADIVLNHKNGGDEQELVDVYQVNEEDRNELIGEKHQIEAYTKFLFPGRKGKYSKFIWDWRCFTGVSGPHNSIYTIQNEYGDKWEELLDNEKGNFDYLMGNDIEFRNPYVREELKHWGKWYIDQTGIDGLRLDAVKHITPHFFNEWLDFLNDHYKKDIFCIAEYWSTDVGILEKYIDTLGGKTRLFDVPLHHNFYRASLEGKDYDMRHIFDDTLTQRRPGCSITFVDNHDTQPLQSLESTVDYWFKPLANALILLREQGLPCIFYPSIFGTKYSEVIDDQEIHIELNAVPGLREMMIVRRELCYGNQHDYFDHANTIGWVREGNWEIPLSGCVVLMSNGSEGFKTMLAGKHHAGKTFVDACGNRADKIVINSDGMAEFYANEGSVSVWIREEALSKVKN
ncbi:alpha-amylase [Flavitalea antarctica]